MDGLCESNLQRAVIEHLYEKQPMIKAALFSLLLSITAPLAAYAQQDQAAEQAEFEAARALPANKHWGWFTTLTEVTDRLLVKPGWEQRELKQVGEGQTLEFANNNGKLFIVAQTSHGVLKRLMFLGPIENKEVGESLIKGTLPVKEGEWADVNNNASITRRYDGNKNLYIVTYTDYKGYIMMNDNQPAPQKVLPKRK